MPPSRLVALLLSLVLGSAARAEASAGAGATTSSGGTARDTTGLEAQPASVPTDVGTASELAAGGAARELHETELTIEQLRMERAGISYKPAAIALAGGLGIIAIGLQDPGSALGIEAMIAGGLALALGGYLVMDNLSKAAQLDDMILQRLETSARLREQVTQRPQPPGRVFAVRLVAARF